MKVRMRFDENNNWMISENHMIYLWEPGRKDKIYRVALVLSNENEKDAYPSGQPHLKVMFVDSGKCYDPDEIDKKCSLPYFDKRYNYNTGKDKNDLIKGESWMLNYSDNLRDYREASEFITLATKHLDNPQQIKLMLDYFNKKFDSKNSDWARWLLDPEEERAHSDYSYLQIPYYKVKEIDAELVQLQEKFFEKDQKTEKEPKKPTSLTEKLKKQYLEPEQGR